MEDYEGYLTRFHYSRYSVVRRFIADILLFLVIVGFGLTISSLAA